MVPRCKPGLELGQLDSQSCTLDCWLSTASCEQDFKTDAILQTALLGILSWLRPEIGAKAEMCVREIMGPGK